MRTRNYKSRARFYAILLLLTVIVGLIGRSNDQAQIRDLTLKLKAQGRFLTRVLKTVHEEYDIPNRVRQKAGQPIIQMDDEIIIRERSEQSDHRR